MKNRDWSGLHYNLEVIIFNMLWPSFITTTNFQLVLKARFYFGTFQRVLKAVTSFWQWSHRIITSLFYDHHIDICLNSALISLFLYRLICLINYFISLNLWRHIAFFKSSSRSFCWLFLITNTTLNLDHLGLGPPLFILNGKVFTLKPLSAFLKLWLELLLVI